MAEQTEDLKQSIKDLIEQGKEALKNNDIDKAKEIQSDIESSKQSLEELETINEQLEQYENEMAEKENDTDTNSNEDDGPVSDEEGQSDLTQNANDESEISTDEDEGPSGDESASDDIDEPSEEDLEKQKKKGVQRNMTKMKKNQETNEEIAGFADYVKSKGVKRDNVVSDDVGVTVPEDIKYNPKDEVNTVQDLSQLVQKENVKTATGKYPILKRANAKFNTAEELAKNPELARPEFKTIDWEVDTYRGAIPISQEAIDDSAVNLTNVVSRNIKEQKVNTLNEKISAVLKSFTPKTVTSVDDLKKLINVTLDPGYERSIIATQSFYQAIDTLKDKNGRYLLNDSIINTSGSTLLGMNVTVVRDDLLGQNGEAKAFIGDTNRAVLFANRSDISVNWVDNDIYGKYLMGAFRFGVKQADENAGFFVTFDTSQQTDNPETPQG